MRVEYRQGLPSVEQVREHEKRGGWWMLTDGKTLAVHRLTVIDAIGPRICMRSWDDRATIDLTECVGPETRYAPVAADGLLLPWPGEPEVNPADVDAALDLLREERDAWRAERALRVREATALREELHHLRQGISAYSAHADGVVGKAAVEEWIERDRCRAEGKQLEIGAVKP